MLTVASDGGEVVMVTVASLVASLADCGELLMLMTPLHLKLRPLHLKLRDMPKH